MTSPPRARLTAGIRFAAAPVGDLRYAPPRPPSSTDASEPTPGFAAAAIQPVVAGVGSTSEDCLFLNVWSPDHAGSRPVVVWIHGGGFETGSASPPGSDGAVLMRGADVVVVSIAYRLGALGFVYAPHRGPEWAGLANAGHLDQVAALRWVRDHVAELGGDPTNVTLLGESAGGFSIGALLAMPSAQGLFQRAIMVSGQASRVASPELAADVTDRFLHHAGVTDLDSARRLTPEQVLAAQHAATDHDVGRRNEPGGRVWSGVHDGAVISARPEDAVRAGAARDVPLLVCSMSAEAGAFELSGSTDEPGTLLTRMEQVLGDAAEPLLVGYRRELGPGASESALTERYITDYVYRLRAARTALDQVAAGGRAWNLLIDAGATDTGQLAPPWHGAVTRLLVTDPSRATTAYARFRSRLLAVVHRFVRSGDAHWDPVAVNRPTALRLGADDEDLVVEPVPEAISLLPTLPFP